MAVKRTTTYECDSCGRKQEQRKELRKVEVEARALSGYDYGFGGRVDLCMDCRSRLVVKLAEFGFDPQPLMDAFGIRSEAPEVNEAVTL